MILWLYEVIMEKIGQMQEHTTLRIDLNFLTYLLIFWWVKILISNTD